MFKIIFISFYLNILIFPIGNGIKNFKLNQFHKYNDIIDYLIDLENNHSDIMKLEKIGKTNYGNDIPLIKLSRKESKSSPIILIDAGIHAREWIAPAVALYIIKKLTTKENKYLLKDIDWYIIPILNPDGYLYSSQNRYWRKNLAKGSQCIGVDLNRNFNYHWGENISGKNECSGNYAGEKPFSEKETQALRNLTLDYKDRIQAYISLHAFGNLLTYPWGYTNIPVSKDFDKLHYHLGIKLLNAIRSVRGTVYKTGRQSSIMYEASGISIDWMAGVAKIPICYIIEMTSERYKFKPPAKEIIPTAREIFEGLKILHAFVDGIFGVKENT